ncbi:MAG: hypothetical protein JWM58_3292 [Rhizobium sp.]|nr:hypothetical protein [Rhizobium sp.]
MDILVDIPLDDIDQSGRIRQADPVQVEALSKSILEVGLLNPISVCRSGDGYRLIAGGNRIEACRLAGFHEIKARIFDMTDLERVIAECDENLCGTKLSASEVALFTVKRKEAYEAIYPETKHGGDVRSIESQSLRLENTVDRFTANTASATGQSERTVQLNAERGEKVIAEALGLIRGTKFDTGVYLDKIKRLSPNDQVTAVKRDLANLRRDEVNVTRQQEMKASLPQSVKDSEAAKAAAKTTRKSELVEAYPERVAELEEAARDLEADVAALKAENEKFASMKALFMRGGYEAVIAGKDEEIRALKTRVASESEAKASYLRSSEFWKAKAKELGWRDTRFDDQREQLADDDPFFAIVDAGA